MRADKFLAGVAYSDCPALLFKMVFYRMESIPTNDLIVILMGVFITCSIHISSAAKASVVKAVAKSTVNANIKSARQQALDDAVSSAIFEAVLERFTELEPQRITPQPASPRLTLSAISALNTSPERPTHRRASLSVSVLSSQETIPQKPKVPALSLSDISSQTSVSVEPEVPVLSISSILTQTSEVVVNKAPAFSFSPVSILSTSPVEPTAPMLSFSPVSTQSSAPMSPKLQPLSISSILAQSSAPVGAKLFNLSLSDIMVMGESVPIMAPSESYVIKWHSGDPRAIIKTLEAITHGLIMQNFKLKASIQVDGTYVAGELYWRKQQIEDLQTHHRSMCIQHVIDKASVAKQNPDIEAFARKVIDLNDQIATLTVLAEKAWASEDALKNQVITVGAQLSEVSISESALKDQVAYMEDQLDEARMRVSKIEVKLDSARGSESALKDKLTNVEMELSETTIAKNELQEQVFDVAAQLDAAMMPESTPEEVAGFRKQLVEARTTIAGIEEELDDTRMSNFVLQQEVDSKNELLGETTALYDKVGNMEVELRDSRNSEQVLQQEVNEYAATIRTIQNAGINIEKYKILANVEVTPIADEVTSSFGAGLDAAADTTTFTSSSEAKSTFLPTIEFESVINTAQTTLNPFASPFSFDTTSTFSPAVAIEVESLVTTPLVTEITTSVESGLGDSQYATVPASVSSPAIEPKSPVTKITTPVKGGLGASKFAPETKSNASPAPAVAIKPAASETTTLSGLGSSKYATASIFNSWPAAEVKPAVNKTTILGGLGSSNHAAAPASNSSPAIEAKTATAKVTTPRLGGLTASKYSDVKPASPALPASNQTPVKNAVVNEPGSSWIQPPGLGEAINLEDYQEKLHCIICAKKVTIEFQFDYGKKFYLWELHQRDFHSKCPDCHKTVPAIWDDKTNSHDFNEHRKVCAVLPAGWAICKFCHEKTPAPLISTPEGRIHDFSKHNTTCPAKAEEKTVHFHCKNCGMGVTDKNDFFKNHKKSCDAKASANGMWYIYDGNTGAFVGPQPAMPTQTTTPKTATPHGTMANFGKQSASATSSSRTPPTGQRGGKAPTPGRRPALPLFGSCGSHSPTTPQVTASPSWQGNVTNYQSQRAEPSQPNPTNTPPQIGTTSASERRPPMPLFGGKAGSRPKTDDGPQWQGNVMKY